MTSRTSSTIWIAIPCYHDAESFARLHREILESVKRQFPDNKLKIVLIDDTAGADDNVSAFKAYPHCIVVTPPRNLGHQAALVFALRRLSTRIAANDYVVTMDADGEDSPEDIALLLKPLIAEPDRKNLVSLARRTTRCASLGFKSSYAVFKICYRALTGTVIRHGNFIAYKGELLPGIIFHRFFDYCYSAPFIALRLDVIEIPIARHKRYSGKSKMCYISLTKHGFKMLLPMLETIAVRGMYGAGGVLLMSGCFFVYFTFERHSLRCAERL